MSKIDVLLGLQWGDEGKGKVVDYLAPKYDIVARFQGGPNAGHTLEFENKKHVLHQIPSGIFREDTLNVIGNGVIIDPIVFKDEIEKIQAYGINTGDRLVLSNKAQLILPTHKLIDMASEQNKGENKIGSTLRGIGPTYKDKIGRNGLRIGDIKEKNFIEKYQKLKEKHLIILKKQYQIDADNSPKINLAEQENLFFKGIEVLRSHPITSTESLLNQAVTDGKKILAEGAQGTLLDIEFGSYPYVTSSITTAAGACTGLGIPPKKINEVFGIFKAYCTRVGNGPFQTELHGSEGEALRKAGNEFGATTGRPRRCGWLDLPALNYACMINGVTQLYMMKADVLSNLQNIKICEKYSIGNTDTQEIPYIDSQESQPKYTELPSWSMTEATTKFKNLPPSLKSFIHVIESSTKLDINMISLGPQRNQTVIKE